MKKIIISIMFLALVIITMCSCNQGMGMGSLNFTHLHYNTYHEGGCINIKKWYDNESGIEVRTTKDTSMFFSEGTYILIGNEKGCPFCN